MQPHGRATLGRCLACAQQSKHEFPLTMQYRPVVDRYAAARPGDYRGAQRGSTRVRRRANYSIHKERNPSLPTHRASGPAHHRDHRLTPVECRVRRSRFRPDGHELPGAFRAVWRRFGHNRGAVVTRHGLFHLYILTRDQRHCLPWAHMPTICEVVDGGPCPAVQGRANEAIPVGEGIPSRLGAR